MDDPRTRSEPTFDRLADRAVPSAELVERTVERSDPDQTASSHRDRFGSRRDTIVASLTAVSDRGRGTRSSHLQVTGPTGVELPAATTTTSRATEPRRRRRSSVLRAPVTTHRCTIPPARPERVDDNRPRFGRRVLGRTTTLTLLDDGDMQAVFTLPVGPAKEVHHYVLDDGTSGSDGIVQTFTPDQFGTHSYDEWSESAGNRSCTEHHTFDVEPSAVTTTTMPGDTTTTSTPSDSTTIPTGTTVPNTSTTIGH